MRPMVTAITQVAVVVLLSCASLAQAQISQIIVNDSPTPFVEGDALNPRNVAVRLAGGPPTTADVTVDFTLVSGSAVAGSDFVTQSGTLTFKRLLDSSLPVVVQVIGDKTDEWFPTLQQDEVFFLQLSNPSANATILKGRGTITLMDDDHDQAGVQYLSAVTDSTAAGSPSTDGRNRLQWRIPPAPAAPSQIKVCWNSASSNCTPPTSDTDTDPGGCSVIDGPFTAGARHLFTHDNTSAIKVQVPGANCYSVCDALWRSIHDRARRGFRDHLRLDTRTREVDPHSTTVQGRRAGHPGAADRRRRWDLLGRHRRHRAGDAAGRLRHQRAVPPSLESRRARQGAHNRSPVAPFPSPLGRATSWAPRTARCTPSTPRPARWSGPAPRYPPASRELLPGATGVQAAPALLVKASAASTTCSGRDGHGRR